MLSQVYMIRKLLKIATILSVSLAAIILVVAIVLSLHLRRMYHATTLDPTRFSKGSASIRGTIFTDRHGRELRFIPDQGGERGRWVAGNEIPPLVKQAFIAAEDGRFYRHLGFDPRAILRAARDNLLRKRVVSGASTITQQTVRLVYPPRKKRSYQAKLTEIFRAMKLEKALSKEEILEQYLNRVPMGSNLVGVETAAQAYFGKRAHHLTAAEAALLASMPKAPSLLNPYGGDKERLLARKDWVLARMRKLGFLSEEQYQGARQEKVVFYELKFGGHAPHLVDQLLAQKITGGTLRTTIDLDLQARVQEILASHRERLKAKGARQGAAIILDSRTREVLATVGSLEYGDKEGGYVNGVLAPRSAGSTLKPFLYAFALEAGYPVTTLLEDLERKYRSRQGAYAPSNFDRRQYGPVTMRTALGNSLNLSAVRMLQLVGERDFYDLLVRLDLMTDPSKGPEHYGLGLAVGNPEVTLEQLTAAYAALASGGDYRPVRYLMGTKENHPSIAVFLPETTYIVSDILSDPTARMLTFGRSRGMDFPFRVCVKTGTSTYYRDLWAVGYTPDYTVGVWVGNFDGSPTAKMSGSSGAAPILNDIMTHLYSRSEPSFFRKPTGVRRVKVCGYSGMRPSDHCRHVVGELFYSGAEPGAVCTFHAKNEDLHELTATYAGWLFDKNRTGSAGRFRMSGFGDDLDRVFHDPWRRLSGEEREPAVRVKNYRESKISGTDIAAPANQRYTIGGEASASAPLVLKTSEANVVRIGYPFDHDRFVIDRMGPNQVIRLQASCSSPVSHIDWYVNGTLYERSGPPYQTWWPLAPGRYRITALDVSGNADSVSIQVE